MSLADWLKNLQSRPENERRRILVASTFSITALIFVIWISVRFSSLESVGEASVSLVAKEKGPIKEISETATRLWENISKNMEAIKSSGNSILQNLGSTDK